MEYKQGSKTMSSQLLVIVLALTVSSIQGYVPGNGKYFGLEDELSKVMEVRQFFSMFNETAEKSLSQGFDYVTVEGDNISGAIDKALNRETSDFLNRIDMIQKQLEAIQNTSLECLKNRVEELTSLSSVYTGKGNQCVQKKIQEGRALTHTAKVDIAGVSDEVDSMQTQYRLCKLNSPIEAVCEIAMLNYQTKVSHDVSKIVVRTLRAFKGLHPDIHECLPQISREFLTAGDKIMDDIDNCIIWKNYI